MPYRVNYKSDFDFLLLLNTCVRQDDGSCTKRPIGWPDYDWEATFWTSNKAITFKASRHGDRLTNCFNDNGHIHIVCNSHHLGCGTLNVDFRSVLPNGLYADGSEDLFEPRLLDIQLVPGPGDCPHASEVELLLPYIKGDKGDPFTYADFTPGQIAELQQPAIDAAHRADTAVTKLEDVSSQVLIHEEERTEAETLRAAAEQGRADAEKLRVIAENARIKAEQSRDDAETKRATGENERIDNEAHRVATETQRESAEKNRQDAETLRAAAEQARQEAEQSRETAESKRTTAETARATAEAERQTAEKDRAEAEKLRATAEAARVTAEQSRREAETLRQAAERQRATAEAERQETMIEIDNIMQGVVTAGPTDSTLQDIEPNIVTDALRKTPQHLTPDEQAQVKANLAIMELTTAPDGNLALSPDGQLSLTDMAKRRLFIDLWNEACGTYGRYNPTTGYFELNGLTDITYQQAIAIYVNTIGSKNTTNLAAGFDRMIIRTNLPFLTLTKAEKGVELSSAFRLSDVEVVNLNYQNNDRTPLKIIDSAQWIFQSANLHTVIGIIQFGGTLPWYNGFGPKIQNIKIANLKSSITFQNCPLLSFESLQFVVDNATNTTTITITVHPDVYTKLTDENNPEWHQLMLDAADKNIQFATV
ncbi:MAG: hypothetical protein HDR82_09765 [Bacteroides sp.]|nr:hypothetical protein [Bacteroides sp.]